MCMLVWQMKGVSVVAGAGGGQGGMKTSESGSVMSQGTILAQGQQIVPIQVMYP